MSPEMTEEEIRQIRTGVKEKYGRVAAEGAKCCFKYPTGREGMEQQGSPNEITRGFPPEIIAAFSGVGNPFRQGVLYPGDAVLDIGCGAGVDSFVAARLVGESGRVVGVDVTSAMLEQARGHLARLGWPQGEFSRRGCRGPALPGRRFRRGDQ